MHALATRGRGNIVRFVALDKQHAHIEEELTEAFVRLLGTSAYTLGTEVEQFVERDAQASLTDAEEVIQFVGATLGPP